MPLRGLFDFLLLLLYLLSEQICKYQTQPFIHLDFACLHYSNLQVCSFAINQNPQYTPYIVHFLSLNPTNQISHFIIQLYQSLHTLQASHQMQPEPTTQTPATTSPITQQPYVGYVKDPDYYFDSYSHFSIHEEMLKDTVRTKSYMNSIMENPQLFKDKIVLDVGSGTGILSIFAGILLIYSSAKSGAKHVYGIEKANIYTHSRSIIEENGLSDKITIINGLVQDITLPVDKVDIIISEWMGYFLLYESMFDSVLFAKEKWLREGGILMPDKAKMYIAALDDQAYYKKKLNFWNNVHGVKMTCIKKWILSEPLVDPIDSQDILTTSKKFYDVNLEKITKEDLEFNSDFVLNVETDGVIHGFVTWFDTLFTHGSKTINLSTSPYKKQTHWKQTVFYIESPFEVNPGDKITGNINVVKAKVNQRELDVCIEYSVNGAEAKKQLYRIS